VLLLGQIRVERNGHSHPVAGTQQAVLLAVLATRLGHVIPTDELIDFAWDSHPPSTAAAALRVHLAKLRALLPDEPDQSSLRHTAGGYVLDDRHVDTDVRAATRFVQLARTHAGDAVSAAAHLVSALHLWRGDPYTGVRDVAALRQEAQRLRELRLDIEDELSTIQLDLGRHTELATQLPVLVRAEPLREIRTRQLMLALYRSGRQADALAAYAQLRDVLADELGVDPSPESRQLELAILRQQPELGPPLESSTRGNIEAVTDPGPRGALDQPTSTPLLRDVVRQRLASLEGQDLSVVRLTAALGERATQDVIAQAAHLPPPDVAEAVARARDVGLLTSEPEAGVLKFTRPALRDEVLADLDSRELSRLHALCAEAITSVVPGLEGAVGAGWHWIAHERSMAADRPTAQPPVSAVNLAASEHAGHALLRALETCAVTGRHDVVRALVDAALTQAPWPTAIETDLAARGVFSMQALGMATEATALWKHGLSVARQSEDVERFALLALARDWTQRSMLSTGEAALPLLGEALELLGPQPSALRVAVASAYCAESVTPGSNAGSTTEINKLLDEVQQQAEALGDDASLRAADYTRHVLLRGSPHLEARRALTRRLRSAAQLASAPALWGAEALLAALFDSCVSGDFDAAAVVLDELGPSADASGSVRLRWQCAISKAALSRERADLTAADALAEEATMLGAEAGIPDTLGADALHRLQVLFHRDDLAPLRSTIEAFIEVQPDNPLVLSAHALTLAHAERGGTHSDVSPVTQTDTDTAADAAVHTAVRRLRRLIVHDEVTTLCAALVVEAIAITHRAEAADREWLESTLGPFTGQFVTFGQVSATWGPVDRLLALLALEAGARQRAFEVMSVAAVATRSQLWRARVDADLARITDH
jgi:DNA-binding SARP family transcriptional activator